MLNRWLMIWKKISGIASVSRYFSSDQIRAILSVLKKYFPGENSEFKQLFELIAEIERRWNKEKVDWANKLNQMQLTEFKTIFILKSIIKELTVNDTENKIAIYIDELGTIGPHNVETDN